MSILPLVAILIAGALLRLHHLGAESVWLDEAFSLTIARTTLRNIIELTAADVHPPLYYLLLFFWVKLAGTTEAAARLLSVTCSLATIVTAYAVARRVCGQSTALVAAALLAVTPFQIEFAQEARMYALLALLCSLSMCACLAMVERPSRSIMIVHATLNALILYTHIHGVFMLAAEVCILAVLLRRASVDLPRLLPYTLASLGLSALFFAPWLGIAVLQILRVHEAFWIPSPPWYVVFHPLVVYAGSWPLAAALVVAALAGLVLLTRGRAGRHVPDPRLVLGVWMLVPIVLPFGLSLVTSPIFLAKYTIAASVPYTILGASGLMAVPAGRWRFGALTVVAMLAAYGLHTFYSSPRKDDWRGAAEYVETRALPGDVILFQPEFQRIPFDIYARRTDLTKQALMPGKVPLTADAVPGAVAEASGTRDRLWLIALRGEPLMPLVLKELEQRYRTVERHESTHVESYLVTGRR